MRFVQILYSQASLRHASQVEPQKPKDDKELIAP
jgi:hypothetical protein